MLFSSTHLSGFFTPAAFIAKTFVILRRVTLRTMIFCDKRGVNRQSV
jgi:hypothetical protein